jgi:hypothetical protein
VSGEPAGTIDVERQMLDAAAKAPESLPRFLAREDIDEHFEYRDLRPPWPHEEQVAAKQCGA